MTCRDPPIGQPAGQDALRYLLLSAKLMADPLELSTDTRRKLVAPLREYF
jgi:hypothetical protein